SSANGWVERIVVDGANGLHFGWVTIATVANTASLLTATGPAECAEQAELWAILVLAAVLVICVASAWATGRIAPALASAWEPARLAPCRASAWGRAWQPAARLAEEPRSAATAVAAIVVAVVVVAAEAVSVVRRIRARERESVRASSHGWVRTRSWGRRTR